MERQRRLAGKRVALFGIGIAMSVLGLWYILAGIEFDALLSTRDRVQIGPLLGSLAVHWLGLVVARAHLVSYLVSSVGQVPVRRAYRYICIAFLVNNILPLRAGEVARIAGVARVAQAPFSSVAGSLAVERALDMAMLAVIGMVTIQLAPLPAHVRTAVFTAAVVFAVGLTALMLLARASFKEAQTTHRGRFIEFLWNLFVRFSSGFKALGTVQGVMRSVGYLLVIWACMAGLVALRLAAFGIDPGLPVVLVMITSLSFSVAMPSAPAYVGVYHAAAVFALGTVMGLPKEVAVGFAFFSWLLDIVPSSSLGLVSMVLEGLSFRDVRLRRTAVAGGRPS